MQDDRAVHDYSAIEQRLEQLRAPSERERLIGKGAFALALLLGMSVFVLALAASWRLATGGQENVAAETSGTAPRWPDVTLPPREADGGVVTTNFTLFRETDVTASAAEYQVIAGHRFETEAQESFSDAWCYTHVFVDGVDIRVPLGQKIPAEAASMNAWTSAEQSKTGVSEAAFRTLFDACPWLDRNPNLASADMTFTLDEDVTEASVDALIRALEAGIRTVALSSPGGEVVQGLRAFRAIRQFDADTVVTGICASACSLIFLGGAERLVAQGGRVGVHRWRSDSGSMQDDQAQTISASLVAVIASAGVSEDFYLAGATTPASDMRWLTDGELRGWGVVTEPGT